MKSSMMSIKAGYTLESEREVPGQNSSEPEWPACGVHTGVTVPPSPQPAPSVMSVALQAPQARRVAPQACA